MAIDWTWIEELLVKHGERALTELASAHAGETFYGALFVIEPYKRPAVHILLNTPEALLADLGSDNAKKPHYKFMPSTFRHVLRLEDMIEQWDDITAAIVEATDADMELDDLRTTNKLLDAVCRAALRLEPTLATLRRTDDFAIGVTPDAKEPGDISIDRYAKFKKRAIAKT